MAHIFQNHADMKSDEEANMNADGSNETLSSATSTPSSKLLTPHESYDSDSTETYVESGSLSTGTSSADTTGAATIGTIENSDSSGSERDDDRSSDEDMPLQEEEVARKVAAEDISAGRSSAQRHDGGHVFLALTLGLGSGLETDGLSSSEEASQGTNR